MKWLNRWLYDDTPNSQVINLYFGYKTTYSCACARVADFLRIWQTLSFFLHVKCGFPTETGGDSNYNKTFFFFSVFFSDFFFFNNNLSEKKKPKKKNQNSYQVCISLGI